MHPYVAMFERAKRHGALRVKKIISVRDVGFHPEDTSHLLGVFSLNEKPKHRVETGEALAKAAADIVFSKLTRTGVVPQGKVPAGLKEKFIKELARGNLRRGKTYASAGNDRGFYQVYARPATGEVEILLAPFSGHVQAVKKNLARLKTYSPTGKVIKKRI